MRAEDDYIVEDLIALNYISRLENKRNNPNYSHIQVAYDLIKELVAIHNVALLARYIECMKYGEKDGSTTDRWAKELDKFLAKVWVPECTKLKLNLVGVNINTVIQLAVDEILKYRTDEKLETIINYDDEQLNKACSISGLSPVKSDKGCFIATAAYGSPLEANVQILQEFRDMVLCNYGFGRYFIQQYYKYSPPIAIFIKKNNFAKQIVRMLLRPVIFSARHLNP